MKTVAICLACLWLAELSVVGTHTTWQSKWWRKPLLFSDRWHLLSLARWPLSCWALWQVAPLYPISDKGVFCWLVAGLGGELIWWAVKRAAGREWPMWWVQAWGWWRGRL